MVESDYHKLREILESEYALHGRSVTGSIAMAWIRHLASFEFSDVEKAFAANGRASGRCPVPADILRYLPDPLGHQGPEEAWNNVPKSEREAGYVTQEMINAWGCARFSVEYGDMVAARMAFIEAYRREVAGAQIEGRKAQYFYSDCALGDHRSRLLTKEQKTLQAVVDRWITPQRAMKILEVLCIEQGKPIQHYEEMLRPLMPGDGSVTQTLPSADTKWLKKSLAEQQDATKNQVAH